MKLLKYIEKYVLKNVFLEDDSHQHNTLTNAARIEMPPSVRLLFCHILIHENLAEPGKLYNAFENKIILDYIYCFERMLNISEEEIRE